MTRDDEPDLARAIEAARHVYDFPRKPVLYEPQGRVEVEAAIRALAARFGEGGGTLNEIIENARAAAEVLSDDPFQALSEIIQNADDAHATSVHIDITGEELTVVHDGRPLTLRDAHALAAPWLTTKRNDASAVGRFGIGLMTLNALADSFEMHSGDYHVRFGAPTLEVVPETTAPPTVRGRAATALLVSLRDPSQANERLLAWARRWDDSALLFLRSVAEVTFSAGDDTQSLELVWERGSEAPFEASTSNVVVRTRRASSRDGRVWVVHDAEFPAPQGVKRAHKATEMTTPVAVAIGLCGQQEGVLHAGLPLTSIDLPLRVNAQFDPIASRQGVATNPWNLALIPLVAELWCHAAVALFRAAPSAAWPAMPLSDGGAPASEVVSALQNALLDVARTSVADRAEITVGDGDRWVGDLAHEVPELEGRLSEREVARLADVDAALPVAARDPQGRWRFVLDDWRAAGNDIAPAVTVVDALRLLDDPDLEAERTLALAAIALDHGLGQQLAATKCVIRPDGTRSTPPMPRSIDFLVASRAGLAAALGLGSPLHELHLGDSPHARSVLAWLNERGSVLPADDRSVLKRLAEAGASNTSLTRRLDDAQLVALRDAVERLDQADWSEVVPAIGGAIRIEGFRFDDRGRRTTVDARPRESYIGRTIDKDRDSFAVAADKTPGLVWVSNHYASELRSSLGRQGLGALRFLRLLGAETAPRVVPHPGLQKRYSSSPRRGLTAYEGGLQERTRAITALGADYTLEDSHSPDLDLVLQHVAADRKPTRRRARAAALIATLGRGWSALSDQVEVDVASASYGWIHRGVTRSWWVWRAATIPWLDDDAAIPRRPIDLRLRTPSTLALHGTDPRGYVHRSFREARSDVLDALGVAGEPSTAELCAGLAELRDSGETAVAAEAAVLYKAIADHLGSSSHTRGDLAPSQLRKSFADGVGLVHTNLGWRRPSDVYAGRPIFGDLAPFAPAISGVERLWRTLAIRAPALPDCVAVLRYIASTGDAPTRETQEVILETLREIGRLIEHAAPGESQARRLARLPLWTTSGWRDKRPVYAVHDPVLASGLSQLVPVWMPGGEVSQFAGLFQPLRLVGVPASAGEVVEAAVDVDEDLSGLFRSAIRLLHDDLVRNDPTMAVSLRIAWSEFEQFEVVVGSQLTVRVPEVELASGPVEVAVNAKASIELRRLFVTDGDLLGRLDGGGRAVAGLFEADHRGVAQAWLAAMERAVAHQEAEGLRLAAERAAEEERRNDQLIEEKTRALQAQVNARAARRRPQGHKESPGLAPETPPDWGVSPPPRRLLDPSTLQVVNPGGDIVGDSTSKRHEKPAMPAQPPPLREPTRGGSAPQQRSSRRAYTDVEKETIGLKLARQVLESDDERMADLRAQRRVGADAIDELRQFFELKVYAGAEPDEIRMTDSEVRRAIDSEAFFLVVVSGVEEGSAEHKVRVIPQPLRQLRKLDSRDMRLGGVRSARGLVYKLAARE